MIQPVLTPKQWELGWVKQLSLRGLFGLSLGEMDVPPETMSSVILAGRSSR